MPRLNTTHKRVTCSPSCADALREDTRCGLIYGPYATEVAGKRKFLDRRAWACLSGTCVYCGGDLPRGRSRYLARHILGGIGDEILARVDAGIAFNDIDTLASLARHYARQLGV